MFSSRFADKVARVSRAFLQHRCTLVTHEPILDEEDNPVIDDEGHPTYSEVSTENIHCLFLWKEVNTTDERGTVIEKTPELYLESNQTVHEGDIVQNVTSRRGTVLLASAKINTIDTTAEGGSESLKVCQLEGATLG